MANAARRRLDRARRLLNLPQIQVTKDGRVDPKQFEHWARTLREWGRDTFDHTEARIGKPAHFADLAGQAIPTGAGVTTIVGPLVDVIPNPDWRYTVDGAGITFYTPGIYMVTASARWQSSTAGTTRLIGLISSIAGAIPILAPNGNPGATVGLGNWTSATRLYDIQYGELLTPFARHDAGADLDVFMHDTFTYYGPTPGIIGGT
jgi:hypothetical protein